MSNRARRRSGKSHRWLIWLGVVGIGCLVAILLAPTLAVNWLRGYVRKEEFRGRMEQVLGAKLAGDLQLAPLRWAGDEVTSSEARIETANGWLAEIDGMRVAMDWNALRQRTWKLTDAGANRVDVSWRPEGTRPRHPGKEEDGASETGATAAAAPGWLQAWMQAWLPNRTEIETARVEHFSLAMGNVDVWALRESRLEVAPWRQEPSVQMTVEGGYLVTPIKLESQPQPLKFNLKKASLRVGADQMWLNEARLEWLEPAEVTARGSWDRRDGNWQVALHLVNVPLRECVTEDWRARLAGRLEGPITIKSAAGAVPTVTGSLQVRDGVVTALPMLDQLAAYTGVERFKRLVLDIASSEVRYDASGTIQFERIVLQSNGLMRLEGQLTLRQGVIDGNFLMGVTQDTLRWFPGAQQHVFTQVNPSGPPGLLWTTLRISGTPGQPREDLSGRLLAGAGKALLAAPGEVVGKGTELLLSPVLGKDAAAQPGTVIKEAGGVLEKGVEGGVRLLDGLRGGLLGR